MFSLKLLCVLLVAIAMTAGSDDYDVIFDDVGCKKYPDNLVLLSGTQ